MCIMGCLYFHPGGRKLPNAIAQVFMDRCLACNLTLDLPLTIASKSINTVALLSRGLSCHATSLLLGAAGDSGSGTKADGAGDSFFNL